MLRIRYSVLGALLLSCTAVLFGAACEDSSSTPDPDAAPDGGLPPPIDAAPEPTTTADADAAPPVTVRFGADLASTSELSAIFYETGKPPVVKPLDAEGKATHDMPAGGDVTIVFRENTTVGLVSCLGVDPGDDVDLTLPTEGESLPLEVTFAPFANATSYGLSTGCESGNSGASSPISTYVERSCFDAEGKGHVLLTAYEAGQPIAHALGEISRGNGGPVALTFDGADWVAPRSLAMTASGALPSGAASSYVSFLIGKGTARFASNSLEITEAQRTAAVPKPDFPFDFLVRRFSAGAFITGYLVSTTIDEWVTDSTAPQTVSTAGALPVLEAVTVDSTNGTPSVALAASNGANYQAATGGRVVFQSSRPRDGGGTTGVTWGLLFAPGTRMTVAPPALPPSFADVTAGLAPWRASGVEIAALPSGGYAAWKHDLAVIDRIRSGRHLTTPGTVRWARAERLTL